MAYRALLTIAWIAGVLIAAALVRGASSAMLRGRAADRPRFWAAQATRLLALATIIVAVFEIWVVGSGSELAAVGGWFAAGLTIALQRVVTTFAAYLIILRGKLFTAGDRIMIGGVRGDVVALGFMQTTVMEMGQPPGEQGDDPSMWVHGRQYSGRIVRVTNDKIFDKPIYNYTRDFPFTWEEIMVPVRYADDYKHVERILLDVAQRHTESITSEAAPTFGAMSEKYFLSEPPSLEPRVYLRLTDNWIELSLRFMSRAHHSRDLKDAISRDVLDRLNAAHIGIASGTYAIVEVPPLSVQITSAPSQPAAAD